MFLTVQEIHYRKKKISMIAFKAQPELLSLPFITPGQAISPTYFLTIDCQNFNLFRFFFFFFFALEEGTGLQFFPQFIEFKVSVFLPFNYV